MFIGHYGVSLAAKRWSPRLSLGVLFVAVQFLDVLFSIFVLAGIEKMAIVHGFTAYNSYDLHWMPYSHSLVGAIVWSLFAGAVCWLVVRRFPSQDRRIAAVVLGAAVFSHFVLDFPVHTPDLPLWPGAGAPRIGLGLWNSRIATILSELAVFIAGSVIYLRSSRARSHAVRLGTIVFFAFLILVLLGTSFQPDPASGQAFAVRALIAYALRVSRRAGRSGSEKRGDLLTRER